MRFVIGAILSLFTAVIASHKLGVVKPESHLTWDQGGVQTLEEANTLIVKFKGIPQAFTCSGEAPPFRCSLILPVKDYTVKPEDLVILSVEEPNGNFTDKFSFDFQMN